MSAETVTLNDWKSRVIGQLCILRPRGTADLSAWVVETREYSGTGRISCDYLLIVLCASFSLAGMASSVGSLWPH
jgi:hypothetical protein